MSDDDPRRRIPRTDDLLKHPAIRAACGDRSHAELLRLIATAQGAARQGEIAPEEVIARLLQDLTRPIIGLTPVLNATGVVVHTNLGRAPLSAAAVAAVTRAAGTVDVELDLATGKRRRRGESALQALAQAVPAAEAVHVVNNCAAALALVAATLTEGDGELLISRGELIEIGDGFRLPPLMAATGAQLVEVGMTNRTRLADYADAVGERTRGILKVHPSNYRVEGFTEEAPLSELATLGLPVVMDVGSGLLQPHPLLPDEPDGATALRAGADLVLASGDKLFGGPQIGLILGRADLIDRVRRHPLARAFRVDKLTLAALEATLRSDDNPVQKALTYEPDHLQVRTEQVAASIRSAAVTAPVVPTVARVGGGGAPGVELPSWAIVLPERAAEKLRWGEPAVLARVEKGRCLVDLRCIPPEADSELVHALRSAVTDSTK